MISIHKDLQKVVLYKYGATVLGVTHSGFHHQMKVPLPQADLAPHQGKA